MFVMVVLIDDYDFLWLPTVLSILPLCLERGAEPQLDPSGMSIGIIAKPDTGL